MEYAITTEIDETQRAHLGRHWRWIMPEPLMPLLVTAFGDFFAQSAQTDDVYLIDTNVGTCMKVAASAEELEEMFDENLEDWFRASLLAAVGASGLERAPGECYSFVVPPMLGGAFEVGNVETCHLVTHSGFMSQVAQQLENIPEGAVVKQVRVHDDGTVTLETEGDPPE